MRALLEIRGLTHFFGGLCAVNEFSLEVARGELVGLIGPNGAGKTTVFNLLTGVYRASRGSIRFKGSELVGLAPPRIAALGVARTFQNVRLFRDLTVLDNVRIACDARHGDTAVAALLRLGRHGAAERRTLARAQELLALLGLERFAGARAGSLPYGMQRRLEIARALALEPELLLLDEPAAGMNPQEITRLMERIIWLRREFGLTILLIEHQMRLVMGICERIAVLDFGAEIAVGRPEQIRAHPKVLEAYLGPAEGEGE